MSRLMSSRRAVGLVGQSPVSRRLAGFLSRRPYLCWRLPSAASGRGRGRAESCNDSNPRSRQHGRCQASQQDAPSGELLMAEVQAVAEVVRKRSPSWNGAQVAQAVCDRLLGAGLLDRSGAAAAVLLSDAQLAGEVPQLYQQFGEEANVLCVEVQLVQKSVRESSIQDEADARALAWWFLECFDRRALALACALHGCSVPGASADGGNAAEGSVFALLAAELGAADISLPAPQVGTPAPLPLPKRAFAFAGASTRTVTGSSTETQQQQPEAEAEDAPPAGVGAAAADSASDDDDAEDAQQEQDDELEELGVWIKRRQSNRSNLSVPPLPRRVDADDIGPDSMMLDDAGDQADAYGSSSGLLGASRGSSMKRSTRRPDAPPAGAALGLGTSRPLLRSRPERPVQPAAGADGAAADDTAADAMPFAFQRTDGSGGTLLPSASDAIRCKYRLVQLRGTAPLRDMDGRPLPSGLALSPLGPTLLTNSPDVFPFSDVVFDHRSIFGKGGKGVDRLALRLETVTATMLRQSFLTLWNNSRAIRYRRRHVAIYVNGVHLLPFDKGRELSEGDVIGIGRQRDGTYAVELQVVAEEAQSAPVAPAVADCLGTYCDGAATPLAAAPLKQLLAAAAAERDPAAAAAQLQMAAAAQPADPQIWLAWGQAAAKAGQPAKARKLLRAATELSIAAATQRAAMEQQLGVAYDSRDEIVVMQAYQELQQVQRQLEEAERVEAEEARQQQQQRHGGGSSSGGGAMDGNAQQQSATNGHSAPDAHTNADAANSSASGSEQQLNGSSAAALEPPTPPSPLPPSSPTPPPQLLPSASPDRDSWSEDAMARKQPPSPVWSRTVVQCLTAWASFEWDHRLQGSARHLWRAAADVALLHPEGLAAGGGTAPLHAWASAELAVDNVRNARIVVGEALDKCSPEDSTLFSLAAAVELAAGDYKLAQAFCMKAYELDRTNRQVYVVWPKVESKIGMPRRARRVFQEGASLHPGDGRLLHEYATFEAQQDNVPRARELWQHAVDAEEDAAGAAPGYLCAWAMQEVDWGNAGAAEELLEEALRRKPDCAAALVGKARLERLQQRYASALELLNRAQEASQLNAHDESVLAERAQLYGDMDEAVLAENARRHLEAVQARRAAKLAGAWGSEAWASHWEYTRTADARRAVHRAALRKKKLGWLGEDVVVPGEEELGKEDEDVSTDAAGGDSDGNSDGDGEPPVQQATGAASDDDQEPTSELPAAPDEQQ